MKHQIINATMKDSEKNLWFSTPGKGVYRLSSGRVINYLLPQQNKSVFSIQKLDSQIYAGSDNYYLRILNIPKKKFMTERFTGDLPKAELLPLERTITT